MLDTNKIREARSIGLSFICSMCENWHEAVSKNLVDKDGDVLCMKWASCRGPLDGGAFEEYTGPLGNNVNLYCHVCGGESQLRMEVGLHGKDRPLGCCKECYSRIFSGCDKQYEKYLRMSKIGKKPKTE